MLPNIEIIRINGKSENIKDYQGKCLLIVNVASECGFTPQYEQFQSFYEEAKKSYAIVTTTDARPFGCFIP